MKVRADQNTTCERIGSTVAMEGKGNDGTRGRIDDGADLFTSFFRVLDVDRRNPLEVDRRSRASDPREVFDSHTEVSLPNTCI